MYTSPADGRRTYQSDRHACICCCNISRFTLAVRHKRFAQVCASCFALLQSRFRLSQEPRRTVALIYKKRTHTCRIRLTSPGGRRTYQSGFAHEYFFMICAAYARTRYRSRSFARVLFFKRGLLLIPGLSSADGESKVCKRERATHTALFVISFLSSQGASSSTRRVCGLNCCVRHGTRWIRSYRH